MTDHEFASVRYIVDDVAASFDFYTKLLGFAELNNFAPAFADVARGPLRLLLSGPTSSGARALPGGRQPCPVAGTGYTSSSMISAARSNDCSQQASSSAARSSRAQAAHRSCSTIRPATRSSCSNRHHDRLLDQQRARRPRSGHHCPDDRGQGVGADCLGFQQVDTPAPCTRRPRLSRRRLHGFELAAADVEDGAVHP